MGYGPNVKPPLADPAPPEKENAAAAGPRNGADDLAKAVELSPALYGEQSRRATFFWDCRSDSIEPLAMRQAVPA